MSVKDNLSMGLNINNVNDEPFIVNCDDTDIKKGDLLRTYNGSNSMARVNTLEYLIVGGLSQTLLHMHDNIYITMSQSKYGAAEHIHLIQYDHQTHTISKLFEYTKSNISTPYITSSTTYTNTPILLKRTENIAIQCALGTQTSKTTDIGLYVRQITIDESTLTVGDWACFSLSSVLHTKFSSTSTDLPYLHGDDWVSLDTTLSTCDVIDYFIGQDGCITLHVIGRFYYSSDKLCSHNETFLIRFNLDETTNIINMIDTVASGYGGCSYVNSTYTAVSTYVVGTYHLDEQPNYLIYGYRCSGISKAIHLVCYKFPTESSEHIEKMSTLVIDTGTFTVGSSNVSVGIGQLRFGNFISNINNNSHGAITAVYNNQIIFSTLYSTNASLYSYYSSSSKTQLTGYYFRHYGIKIKKGALELINTIDSVSLNATTRIYYRITSDNYLVASAPYNVTPKATTSNWHCELIFKDTLDYYNPSHYFKTSDDDPNPIGLWSVYDSDYKGILGMHITIANAEYLPYMYTYTTSSSDNPVTYYPRPTRLFLISDKRYDKVGHNTTNNLNINFQYCTNTVLNYGMDVPTDENTVTALFVWDVLNFTNPVVNNMDYTVYANTFSYYHKFVAQYNTTRQCSGRGAFFTRITNPLKVTSVETFTSLGNNIKSYFRNGCLLPHGVAVSNKNTDDNTIKVKFLI